MAGTTSCQFPGTKFISLSHSFLLHGEAGNRSRSAFEQREAHAASQCCGLGHYTSVGDNGVECRSQKTRPESPLNRDAPETPEIQPPATGSVIAIRTLVVCTTGTSAIPLELGLDCGFLGDDLARSSSRRCTTPSPDIWKYDAVNFLPLKASIFPMSWSSH